MAAGAGRLSVCLGRDSTRIRDTGPVGWSTHSHADRKGNPSAACPGSIFWLAFSDRIHIRRSSEIDADSMAHFTKLHGALLERGVYLGPSGYEVGFVSAAHTDAVIDEAVSVFTDALDAVFG